MNRESDTRHMNVWVVTYYYSGVVDRVFESEESANEYIAICQRRGSRRNCTEYNVLRGNKEDVE